MTSYILFFFINTGPYTVRTLNHRHLNIDFNNTVKESASINIAFKLTWIRHMYGLVGSGFKCVS